MKYKYTRKQIVEMLVDKPKTICHVNPNRKDPSRCQPHTEFGPVTYKTKEECRCGSDASNSISLQTHKCINCGKEYDYSLSTGSVKVPTPLKPKPEIEKIASDSSQH